MTTLSGWLARVSPSQEWASVGGPDDFRLPAEAAKHRAHEWSAGPGDSVEVLSPLGIVFRFLLKEDGELTQTGGPVPMVVGREPARPRPLGGFGGPPDGLTLIAKERLRQVSEEEWTAAHDDEHDASELAWAAVCYAAPSPVRVEIRPGKDGDPWPFAEGYDKRAKSSRIRELVKAGALIAAEIDRRLRLGEKP